MYKVIGRPNSRAFRVMWMLEELGQDYKLIPASPHSDKAKAANPSGKIPALQDGDTTLTDSMAILTYLGDKHRQMTFKAGTIDRARQDAMTFLLLDEFEAPLWAYERLCGLYPKERQVPEVAESLKWEFRRNLPRLSAALKNPFVMGDQMTIADILCTSCLTWAQADKFEITDQRLLDYAQAMRARPAFKTARQKGMATM